MKEISYWVEQLKMEPHPEGGYFKETYRSKVEINKNKEFCDFKGVRSISTGIYFLIHDDNYSAFHKIKSDEMWHFYEGDPLEVFWLSNGQLHVIVLGRELDKGQVLQAVVPANCWFGSRMQNKKGYALVGCTVSPGFDFDDFELAKANELVEEYPQYEKLIHEMCRM